MPEAFERQLNEVAPLQVLDGYAPFCKLHVHCKMRWAWEGGGSDVPLDREAYCRSVEFWRMHANWRG